MSMADRSEGEMTQLVEKVVADLVPDWMEMPLFQRYQIKDQILPVLTACIKAVDEEPHKAKRGSDIEAWIKRLRDERDDAEEWAMVDVLLDDYRLHADTGTPLSEEAHEGPSAFPET